MRCDDLQGLVAGLAAGDLTPAQEEVVRLHLQTCADCQGLYAGLIQTSQHLAQLAADYRPDLADRIGRAIERSRGRQAIWDVLTGGLRAMGALSAIALVVALLLWQRGAGAPAGRAPETEQPRAVYVLRENQLVEIDLLRRRTGRSVRLPTTGEFWPGGLLNLGAGYLYALDPADPLQLVAVPVEPEQVDEETWRDPLGGQLLLRSGSVAWAVRSEWHPVDLSTGRLSHEPRFAVDRVDLKTGEIDRDPEWKGGLVRLAVLSPNGSHLYLLAELGGSQYVKVIDTQSRRLVNAYLIAEPFSPLAHLLASPDGASLLLLDRGRALALDLPSGSIRLALESPEVTAAAALSPDSANLLTARPDGGLALWEVSTGSSLRLTDGPRYRSITWKGGWIYAAHDEGIDLIAAGELRVESSLALALPGPLYVP